MLTADNRPSNTIAHKTARKEKEMMTEIVLGVLTLLFSVIGWLLSNKDMKQAKEIEILFKKHDDDAAALAALKLEIAKEHYLKHELDARFQQLDTTFREGFDGLRSEFKELGRILIGHITKEDV
jgi:hypothetical protein